MRFSELLEDAVKHVTFCFGRMNPPTIGHAEVFKTMAGVGGDYKIFVTQSQDKKENPLSYPEKVKFIKAIHPEYAQHMVEDTNLNTIGKVCSYLYDQGYRNVTFVAGSDRLPQFQKLIGDYNGVEGKAHGFYKFETLDFKSSGQRDPDSPGVSGVSASKAREAAATGNIEKFEEATGAGQYAKPMYDAVRKGMGIKESFEEGLKSKMAGAALAAANLLGSPAQAAEEPVKPITVAYVMIDGEMRTYNLGDKFKNAKEAEEFISNVLDKQGLSGYTLQIKHGYPKKKEEKIKDDSDPVATFLATGGKIQYGKPQKGPRKPGLSMASRHIGGGGDKMKASRTGKAANTKSPKVVGEAPIELDRNEPMNPMIYGHDKANPAKLQYRMMRAAGQLKDLASRAENASPGEWQLMTRQFEELAMNIEQIRHALEELSKIKSKGGIKSRGITV